MLPKEDIMTIQPDPTGKVYLPQTDKDKNTADPTKAAKTKPKDAASTPKENLGEAKKGRALTDQEQKAQNLFMKAGLANVAQKAVKETGAPPPEHTPTTPKSPPLSELRDLKVRKERKQTNKDA